MSWLKDGIKGAYDKVATKVTGFGADLETMINEGRAIYVQELSYPLLMHEMGDGATVLYPKPEFSVEVDTLEVGAVRQHSACTFDVVKGDQVFKVRAEGLAVCPQEMMELVSLQIDGREVKIGDMAALPEPAVPYLPPKKPEEPKKVRKKKSKGFGTSPTKTEVIDV
eukprot:TRINITY_DN15809_c0_g1_i6.p1 TRINITY_DN15809_c0_g1~~TRINITY_DN15809_c0_g1_i6.p1  ORF type:complete len:167 (+),score=39.43 TRINITY_DN15809_c0_g1_i6:309-809(+)